MRGFIGFLLIAGILTLAFWAYQENYRTRRAMADLREVQQDIGRLRERRDVLEAEWAYLNRPSRLQELAGLNFARLGLLPMAPEAFAELDQIAYPLPEEAAEAPEADAEPDATEEVDP